MEYRGLLIRMMEYIEDKEIEIDAEYGDSRGLKELIDDGVIPSLYYDIRYAVSKKGINEMFNKIRKEAYESGFSEGYQNGANDMMENLDCI